MDEVTRRRLLQAAGALGGVAAIDALGVEPRWLDVSEHEVPVPGLASSLEGFRVAHVTDAHLGSLGWVEEGIARAVARLDVNLVTLGGDLVYSDEQLGVLGDFVRAVSTGGRSVIATLGNWEHWGHVDRAALERTYVRSGAMLLVNDAALASGVSVLATDDRLAGDARLDVAARNVPEKTRPRLLLTHSPAFLDEKSPTPAVDLALAGHTHGGQIRLGSGLVPWLPPGSGRFVGGWYDTALGRAYVSRGTGTSIAPARFTCRPELPVFRLVRA
jgi:uncharacterized protein